MGKVATVKNVTDSKIYSISSVSRHAKVALKNRTETTEHESAVFLQQGKTTPFHKPIVVFHSLVESNISIEDLHNVVFDFVKYADFKDKMEFVVFNYFGHSPYPLHEEIFSVTHFSKIYHVFFYDVQQVQLKKIA